MKIPRSLVWISHGVSVLFLGMGILFPLVSAFLSSGSAIGPAGGPSLGAMLFDPVILRVTKFTLMQAGWSVLLSVLIGLPLGLWVRGGRRVEALLALPFGIPTLVVAAAWTGILGSAGLLARLGLGRDWGYSVRAVILAHVFLNAPWIALRVSQARGAVSRRLLEAAGTLGARPGRRFLSIVWPEVRGSLLSAACQVFSLCAMSFTLVLILGGGPPVETLETSIYSRIRFSGLDLRGALACAVWQTMLTIPPWLAARKWEGSSQWGRSREEVFSARTGSWTGSLVAKFAVALFFLLPYLFVVFSALHGVRLLGGAEWREVAHAFSFSFQLALGVSLACLIFSALGVISCSQLGGARPWAESLWVFSGGLSTLVLSLCVWLAYERWIDFFSGAFLILVFVQTLIFLPVVFRILNDTAAGVRIRLLEAASTMGAPPIRGFWFIEWPRWRAPVMTAFGIVLIASLGEVAAVSLFVSENVKPLPFLMVRWMNQYRFGEAEVVGALLVIMASVLMLSLTWVRTHERWTR